MVLRNLQSEDLAISTNSVRPMCSKSVHFVLTLRSLSASASRWRNFECIFFGNGMLECQPTEVFGFLRYIRSQPIFARNKYDKSNIASSIFAASSFCSRLTTSTENLTKSIA